MASSSNTIEELSPSTSTSSCSGSPMAAFSIYKPPPAADKLAFQCDKRYHVFLSFRGEDVRNTLVDHLFEALSTAGLNVFLDSDKLEKGKMIWLSLERAIESSVIRIPIFSKGYADSVWCLKEAATMLKTPGLIIPLFYHMDPTDVRYPLKESSPYKQAFLRHYSHPNRYSKKKIECWKNALGQICCRSGWSTDITQGYEAQLIKLVVNDLIKTLDRVPLEVAKHPVGLENIKNSLIQKLNLNSMEEVVKVGIWGMGGIGKTTAAKAVFNQIYASFEAACFVFNVRATATEAAGLTILQKKILEDLTKYNGKVDAVDKGISLFKDRLGGKRVLLILDDVDTVDQLYALVGDWLAPGSRVVITSRDKHILNIAECVDEMTGLEKSEGLQLFSWHAFLRASPSPKHQDLCERIVESCKGHPLSLEVIGSSLYDKENETDCWIEALHNITLNPDIHKRLYISYSGLTDDEKEIFVDIACFFIGEHKRLPIVFWKSLYEMVDTALLNLAMKLLIKIDEKGVFEMHDHLREMGRTIAKREKQGTRLWNATNLSTVSNNINLSHLRLNGGNPQRLGIEGNQQQNVANLTTASNDINFSCPWVNGGNPLTLKMLYKPGLRYLHLEDLPIEGMAEDTLAMLPPSLIWLRLKNCTIGIGRLKKILTALRKPFQSGFVGNNVQLKIVQVDDKHFLDNLSVSSFFTLSNIQLVQHLELNWFENLKKLPDTTGNLLQLQHLELRGCRSLKKIPDAIGNLSQLQHLNLERCWSLNNLPDTIGNLSQLKHLNFEGCKCLNKLPDTIGNLSGLQRLNLESCWRLKRLPCTIGKLSQLQHLNLSWCISLKKIPYTIGNLSQLQHLNLERCWSLISIPNTIGDLSELQHLNLSWCITLQTFPHTIGNLSQLQHLNFYNCKRLNSIPDTIDNLSQLQYLKWKNGWIRKYRNIN